MRRNATLVVWALLALVVIAAAAVQGTAQFTGPRWNPRVSPPSMRPAPADTSRLPSRAPAAPRHHPAQSLFVDPALVAGIVLLVAALIAGALIWRWLRDRPSRFTPTVNTVGSVLAGEQAAVVDETDARQLAPAVRRGLARAIEVLDEDRAPSDAIVAAWLGLQEAADDSGIHRRGAETPTEFTVRIIRRAGADPRAATTLLRLYQDVRFGGVAATDADIAHARSALRALAEAWHPDATRTGTPS